MIDKYLSDKLRLISFFSIIMVVFLHSYNLGEEMLIDFSIKKNYVFFIQYFISQGITRVAVPIFFTISGYLLFFSKKQTINDYKLLLQKRFKSLVIPYLFWSILLFFVFFLLQNLSLTTSFFKQKHINTYTIIEVIKTIFINPIPFQLWFIRDLFVFIVLSPAIYVIIKYLKTIVLFLLLILWFLQFDFVFFSNEALLFFTLGAFLAINKVNLKNYNLSKKSIFLITVWLSIVLCESLLVYYNFSHVSYINVIHKSGILIGIYAIWFFYDFIFIKDEVLKPSYMILAQLSFFIYVFHEPFLDIIKIVFFKVFGNSEFLLFFLYVTSPAFTILVCLFVGQYLKRFTPVFFKIITGGR